MTTAPLTADDLAPDFAAGRAAFADYLSIHQNPHLDAMHLFREPTIAERQRFEAWRAGWIAAAKVAA